MATESQSASSVDAAPYVATASGAHGGTTEAVGHPESGGGLPQFRFEYWGGQIVWLLILFAVLYVLFARVFVPRFRAILDVRAKTIGDALAEARRAQVESDEKAQAVKAEIDKARVDARKLVADARTKAADDMASTQARQDAELAARIQVAEVRIRGLRDSAMGNVRDIASETAADIVSKLTGKSISAAETRAAESVA